MALTQDHVVSSALAPPGAARVRFVAILLGVAAATVSVVGSWIPSFWGDEAASVLSANRSLPSLFAMLGHVDAVHGTYYLGLHFWAAVFGSSPFSVRFPSALAIGACVAGVVLLCTKLDSLKLGVVAGVICAVLPRVTGMGDEARSYAFTAAIATWFTVLFIAMLQRERPSRRQWIAYGVVLAVGTYVFLYLALIAAAHAAILALSSRTRPLLRPWVRTVLIVMVTVSPLIIAGVFERGQIAFLADRTTADFYSLAVTLWFGTPAFAVLSWAAIVAALGFLIKDLQSRRRAGLSNDGLPLSPVVVAAAWLVVPSVLLIGSHFIVPDFTARYLSMCAPAAAVLMAIGVLGIVQRKTIPLILICAAIVAAALPGWLQQRSPYAKNNSDWAVISSEIGSRAHAGDAVAFDDSTRPSRRTRLAMRTYPAGFRGLDDVTLKTPYFADATWHDSTYSIAAAKTLGRMSGVKTIWLVEYATPTHTDTAGTAELRALGFTQVLGIHTHRSVILRFVR
ncbi:MAG: glycosyltransferase family 39 protein [Lacisediminihabitans sp.]